MIEEIRICTLQGKTILKKKYGKHENFKLDVNILSSYSRNFFELGDKDINIRVFGDLKIIIVSEKENAFLIQSYIEILVKIFSETLSNFTQKEIFNKFEKVNFILDSMILNGKIVQPESNEIMKELESFVRMDSKKI